MYRCDATKCVSSDGCHWKSELRNEAEKYLKEFSTRNKSIYQYHEEQCEYIRYDFAKKVKREMRKIGKFQ